MKNLLAYLPVFLSLPVEPCFTENAKNNHSLLVFDADYIIVLVGIPQQLAVELFFPRQLAVELFFFLDGEAMIFFPLNFLHGLLKIISYLYLNSM